MISGVKSKRQRDIKGLEQESGARVSVISRVRSKSQRGIKGQGARVRSKGQRDINGQEQESESTAYST